MPLSCLSSAEMFCVDGIVQAAKASLQKMGSASNPEEEEVIPEKLDSAQEVYLFYPNSSSCHKI